jgi:hypothetical protein
MNERLRTAVLALAALAAFVALFQSNLRPPGRDGLSRPVSVDRQADGLAALATWLERDGRAVVSFRESYAELATQARAQAGNLLIIALPARERVPSAELPLLDAWLQQGNTLLVLAALADAPEWARERGATFDLSALTALDFRRERIAAPDTATDPRLPRELPPRHAACLSAVRRCCDPPCTRRARRVRIRCSMA